MKTVSISHIFEQSYEYVSEDYTFLRLTVLSTIVHSMIFMVVVFYNIIQTLSKINHQRSSTIMRELSSMAQQLLNIDGLFMWIIGLGLLLAIGYYILPPIGEAAMVFHLNKSFTSEEGSSVFHGMKKFFVMFELNSLMGFISVSSFLIIFSRVWILGIITQPLIIAVMMIYGFIVLATVVGTPYVKFKVVLEQENLTTAIKDSFLLALSHPHITGKLALVGLLLNLRIIFNIIVLLGVPACIFYVAYIFELHQTTLFYIILSTSIVTLFILIAYINSIIEAFFMTYRYLGYRAITGK